MMKKQRGVTMIELLISMVLGLSLVAGIGQLFVQSQKSFRLQRNLSDMTDDASFILESLAKGVLLAGYAENPKNAFSDSDSNISPVSGVGNISLDVNEFIKGTDTQLVYRYKLGYGIPANGGTQISDGCMIVSGKRKGTCELDNFVGTVSLTGIKDDLVTVRVYKKNDSDGIPVFYSKSKIRSITDGNDTVEDAQPLISEVENLEFRYGIKTGTGFYYYTKAENVTDWTIVFAVKVFLVMRSVDDNLVRVQSGYKIDGVDASPAPTDRRLYKTFSKTIFLRTPIQ